MNSYIEIKQEIEKLEKRLSSKNQERNDLLLPLFKLIKDNGLNNVLPSNLDNYLPKNLPLRLTILSEEVEINNLKDKEKILSEIEDIKRKIIDKNNEQIIENQRIDNMRIKLKERKEYVLSRIPEINDIDKQIEKLQSGIDRRLKILNEGSLEKEEQRVIREIINKNIKQVKELETRKQLILNEKGLYSDIKQIEKEDNLVKKEETKEDKKVNTNSEQQKPNSKFLNKIENINSSLNKIEDTLDEKIQTAEIQHSKVEDPIIKEQAKKIDLSIPIKEEPIKKSNPISFEIEEIKEDTPNNIKVEEVPELPNSESKELTVPNSNDLTVVETHSNFLLETKLKLKKGLRIILGLKNITAQKLLEIKAKAEKKNTNIGDTISNLIGGIVKTPESKIVDKARESIEAAKKILEENKDDLSEEEIEKIKANLSRVYLKLNQARNDKTHQRHDSYYQSIAELENISDQLSDDVTTQYNKIKAR